MGDAWKWSCYESISFWANSMCFKFCLQWRGDCLERMDLGNNLSETKLGGKSTKFPTPPLLDGEKNKYLRFQMLKLSVEVFIKC